MINRIGGKPFFSNIPLLPQKQVKAPSILEKLEKTIRQDRIELREREQGENYEAGALRRNANKYAQNAMDYISKSLSEYDKAVKTYEHYANAVAEDERKPPEPMYPTLQQGFNKKMLKVSKDVLDEFTDCNSERNQQLKGKLLLYRIGFGCMSNDLQVADAETDTEIESKSKDKVKNPFNILTNQLKNVISNFQFDKNDYVGFMNSLKDMFSDFQNGLSGTK